MQAADIETDLRRAMDRFDTSPELRECRACGHVQPDPGSRPHAALTTVGDGLPNHGDRRCNAAGSTR
jgi:hypothetical protein